jgi:hypothetical protein
VFLSFLLLLCSSPPPQWVVRLRGLGRATFPRNLMPIHLLKVRFNGLRG